MEYCFFHLEAQLAFSQLVLDLSNELAMFSQVPGVHEDVINVEQHKAVEVLPKHFIYKAL